MKRTLERESTAVRAVWSPLYRKLAAGRACVDRMVVGGNGTGARKQYGLCHNNDSEAEGRVTRLSSAKGILL
jgi:hypothetical protein